MKKHGVIQNFPFYYGWVIVGASAMGMLFSVPGQTIGVSVFTDYLIEALGLSRDQLSLAYMIGTMSSAAVLSVSGVVLDKIGSRKFGTIVSILLGSLLIALSFIDDAVAALSNLLLAAPPVLSAMLLMSFGFFLLRFLGQGSMTLVSRNLPMRWFTKRRGLVSAIVGTVVSFGFNAAPALYDAAISAAGWKGAWRISGIIVLGVGTLLYLLVVRDTPESLGLHQDGIDPNASTFNNTENDENDSQEHPSEPHNSIAERTQQKEAADAHAEDATLGEALRSLRFWLYGMSLGLSSLYVTGLTFHVVSIFAEAGIERSSAVAIFIPISILSVLINIGVSSLSDYIRLKYLLAVLLVGLMFSMTGVFLLKAGIITTAMIVLGNGLSGGTFNALTTLSWPRFYGTTHLGAISGFNMGILVAGSALGPYLLSVSLSVFGSYGSFSLATAAVALLLLVASMLLPEEAAPARPAK